MIDHNVSAAARLHDVADEPGALEQAMLGSLEAHDGIYQRYEESRAKLRAAYERVLQAWLYPGAVIDTQDLTKPAVRCLLTVKVHGGTARGAHRFRVTDYPSVRIDGDGSPGACSWSCPAMPISPKTGQEMSGRPSGAFRNTDAATIGARVFTPGYSELEGEAWAQHERDEFMKMVEQAQEILAGREAEAEPTEAEAGPRG